MEKTVRNLLDCTGRVLPLKHRYCYTKEGRVRLRFMLPAAMTAVLAVSGGLTVAAKTVTVAAGAVSGSVSGIAFLKPADTTLASASSGAATAGQANMGQIARQMAAIEPGAARQSAQAGAMEVASIDPAVAAAPAVPAGPKEETIEIGKGDTLAGVLNEAGLSAEDSHRAVESLRGHYDPRRLRPGQKLHIRYDPLDDQGSNYQFVAMQFDKDPLELVTLTRGTGDNFETSIEKRDVEERVYGKKARIETSLYGSALKAGIPASVIAEAIRVYSWDVDFQRDIKQGDSLEVMYSQNETSEGVKVGGGNILYANLVVGGNRIPVYRYKNEFGDDEFYKEDGSSVRKALLKTPIDGARLSSGFGYRRHPILGYNKLHKGTDFAAPRGTPIFAAGSGVVEMAGPFSSYGNYVRIRHNGEYKTAYAHMQRFAPGIKSGQRVKQGQVIGYVGTTGRSTGPHLHFEVLKNNTQINPQGVKMQDSEKLQGPALVAFKARIGDLKQQYSQLRGRVKYASR